MGPASPQSLFPKAIDIYESKKKDPIKVLWRNVLVVAIEDAIKAMVTRCRFAFYQDKPMPSEIRYIKEYNQDFATICHYANLDHNLVRRKVNKVLDKIEESYEKDNLSDVQGQWLHKGNRFERARKIRDTYNKPVSNV